MIKSDRLKELNLKSRELLSSCKKRSASERNNKTYSFVQDESKVNLNLTKDQEAEDLTMFKDYIDNFMKGSHEDTVFQNKRNKEKREASEESREKLLSKIPAVTRLRERVDKVTCMNPRDRELEQRAMLMPEVILEQEDKATRRHKETKQISRNLKEELDKKAEVFVKNNISLVKQIHDSKDIELKQQSLLIHSKYKNNTEYMNIDNLTVEERFNDMQKDNTDYDILKSLNTMGVLSNLRSNLKISQE